jgi:uncharacterized protein DUF3224
MTTSRTNHRQASAESTVTVTGYDRTVISEADNSGIALVSTVLHEEFAGSLAGIGVADHIRIIRPDGDTFTGIERFTGTLDGRPGSFALTAKGYTVDGIVHGRWKVVAGSATGALKGLRGHGVFTAEPAPPGTEGQNRYPTATDCFTYWYEN